MYWGRPTATLNPSNTPNPITRLICPAYPTGREGPKTQGRHCDDRTVQRPKLKRRFFFTSFAGIISRRTCLLAEIGFLFAMRDLFIQCFRTGVQRVSWR